LLSGSLTVTAFGLFAVSLTLIPLLTGRGFSASLAALTFGLIGAGQLLGRIGFAPLGAHTSPSTGAGIILGASAVSVALLAILPGPAGLLIAVAVLLGITRGATTLLQATVVAARWGTARYGTLAGYFIAPITVASALAPWAGTAIASALHSYPITDAILAVLVAAGAVTVSVSGKSRRSRADPP
jgi:MFS family permease